MMRVRTRVGPSLIEGLGLFAVDPLPAGTTVWALTPGLDIEVPRERYESVEGPEAEFLGRYAYYDPQRQTYLLCADDARFMNHSAEPNVSPTVDDRCWALRDIAAGEELTCNYHHIDPRPMRFAPRAG